MATKPTAEQRAAALLEEVPLPWLNKAYEDRFKAALTAAIQAHEDAVREECAEVADGFADEYRYYEELAMACGAAKVADALRTRAATKDGL